MMTPRERFQEIARFKRGNDPFVWGIAAWNETLRRWVGEGMPIRPVSSDVHQYLVGNNDVIANIKANAAGLGLGENGNPPWVPPLEPFFEPVILQEEEEHIIKRDYDGTIVRLRKDDQEASMPQWLEFPVKDKKDWDNYKKRLDPHSPGRWLVGWDIMSEDTVGFPLKPGQKGKSLYDSREIRMSASKDYRRIFIYAPYSVDIKVGLDLGKYEFGMINLSDRYFAKPEIEPGKKSSVIKMNDFNSDVLIIGEMLS